MDQDKTEQAQDKAATEGANERAERQKKKDRDAKASRITSQLMTRPSFMAAHTAMSFVPNSMRAYGEPGVFEMWEEHRDRMEAVVNGDMTHPESLLIGQAMSLNSIYNWCAELAGANVGKSLPQAEALMRMALKAQAQCTQTLRVLGELKAPKSVSFIKQQNNAAGPQQVNNGPVTQGATPARAHESESNANPTNELLTDEREAQNAATLDAGATGRAGRENKTLETVGAIDRTED
ncbi:hypothetical protein [Paraburkholderia hospita]|uniref:hypothetical protein n=1 Tax=Paraburkholderia hospita TaxID=169430 RepID=UPI000B344300|nr:hypothetical protein [Paraburkholderia hospita]OUL68692.1 hypothetical protein CA603_51540 [Paraburkholderia hospita]